MTVKVYNQDGAEVGTVELKPEVFGIEPNEAVVHQYLVNYPRPSASGNGQDEDAPRGVAAAARSRGVRRAPVALAPGTTRSPLWRGRRHGLRAEAAQLWLEHAQADEASGDPIDLLRQGAEGADQSSSIEIELGEIKTKKVVDHARPSSN